MDQYRRKEKFRKKQQRCLVVTTRIIVTRTEKREINTNRKDNLKWTNAKTHNTVAIKIEN